MRRRTGGGKGGEYPVGVWRWDFCDFEGGASYLFGYIGCTDTVQEAVGYLPMMRRDVLYESYLASMRDHELSIQDNAFLPT